jgi:hypothetical protein
VLGAADVPDTEVRDILEAMLFLLRQSDFRGQIGYCAGVMV